MARRIYLTEEQFHDYIKYQTIIQESKAGTFGKLALAALPFFASSCQQQRDMEPSIPTNHQQIEVPTTAQDSFFVRKPNCRKGNYYKFYDHYTDWEVGKARVYNAWSKREKQVDSTKIDTTKQIEPHLIGLSYKLDVITCVNPQDSSFSYGRIELGQGEQARNIYLQYYSRNEGDTTKQNEINLADYKNKYEYTILHYYGDTTPINYH